jgi:hypothetical protein
MLQKLCETRVGALVVKTFELNSPVSVKDQTRLTPANIHFVVGFLGEWARIEAVPRSVAIIGYFNQIEEIRVECNELLNLPLSSELFQSAFTGLGRWHITPSPRLRGIVRGEIFRRIFKNLRYPATFLVYKSGESADAVRVKDSAVDFRFPVIKQFGEMMQEKCQTPVAVGIKRPGGEIRSLVYQVPAIARENNHG